jgi:nitroimidazol reductase NimA-like FMN-containing flavoprotein (pyridoxamine 5'-phosphate oxidase superfamily)
MRADDPAALDIIRRSMVARIATLSGHGRPSVNPLYFVYLKGHIWLGTVEWTLAARNVEADPRVSILFDVERDPTDHRVLRISGRARLRTDRKTQRSYDLRVARKYVLTPGGIRNALTHARQLPLRRSYHTQAAERGRSCVIEVTPERAELLNDDPRG